MPGVILTKFLILGDFQLCDSYKKNSYKKETVYRKVAGLYQFFPKKLAGSQVFLKHLC